MLDTYVRSWVQYPIDFLAAWASRYAGANALTFCGLICGVLTLPFLALHWPYLACMSLLLSGLFDVLDGSVARLRQTASAQGAVLDIYCDRVVEGAVIFGLCLQDPQRAFWGLGMLFAVLLCITSFLVVGIFSTKASHKSFYYSPGLMERTEAWICFVSMILFPSVFSFIAGVFIVLVIWTSVYRVVEFCRHAKEFRDG